MPPNDEPKSTARRYGERDTPILAMESISQKERVERRRTRPSRLSSGRRGIGRSDGSTKPCKGWLPIGVVNCLRSERG